MPKFFFHLRSKDGFEHDREGIDCDSLDIAYLEAHKAVFPISADMAQSGKVPTRHSFEIADARGQVLLILPFSEAFSGSAAAPMPRNQALLRTAHDQAYRMRTLRGQVSDEFAKLIGNLQITRALLGKITLPSRRPSAPLDRAL